VFSCTLHRVLTLTLLLLLLLLQAERCRLE
jgi:hypothetical protein